MSQVKIRDHVGLLQKGFEELLNLMYESIDAIQKSGGTSLGNEPKLKSFDEIPQMAEEIVKKVKVIDLLIDEASEQTCIGKDTSEIIQSLTEKSEDYENEVRTLSEYNEKAELWLGRIHEMLNVIARNTPWMQQTDE